ncbi:MAG: methylenetetrahydrofolate reductase C-terminal domain-containing protein [Deltaproteobacteria bacterium]|nr:methylenetetrahydrofolate reductase C-terminal domain-containing protein [Deltaproteobacteria bacterium]MBW1921342.1 methylenetetrahydrofolate reductase C-terminal domain-containing protein [Deltaproteobacteria bacterium]MBW1936333.1 methylenetetrahydrofolate reductase C-terminal domain-containing protein [Deltaproteobacteria bacterium]MBW1978948.1 methylenetetrahydrofolate reductase C-terminal domain-containing protein [Deltaproteobacteria bacterium]MBW2045540.1 methylenetetrahydrofolate re
MIVANRKPLAEIREMVENCDKILILGCKGCVTVCNVGGAREVSILASILRIARKKEGRLLHVDEMTIERQCDPEYIEQVKDRVGQYDAVVSMACGVGPQFLSEAYPAQRFFPAVNTTFFGGAIQHGVWAERCAGCGTCIIHYFDGMCPIARCSKSLLHGPCGGSANGKCEISKEVDCIWDKIVRKKMEEGHLKDLLDPKPPKDWRTARDGGPRKSVREELVQ